MSIRTHAISIVVLLLSLVPSAKAQFELGLEWPDGWPDLAPWDPTFSLDLPSQFNWEDVVGALPVRDQSPCGTCWAFATLGVLEYQILIQDRVNIDLSEEWLMNCNVDGKDCDSGGFASYNYFVPSATEFDDCGVKGAVLESDYPYVGQDESCPCPLDRYYWAEGWSYIGFLPGALATTEQLKTAIYNHGPIWTAIWAGAEGVDGPFKNYDGGVYDGCADDFVLPNHAVVLVGWDDSKGPNGCWRLRNSWGTDWGENGYMWIPYGCNEVGLASSYLNFLVLGDGIWIDANFTDGNEQGTYWRPYNTLIEGLGMLNDEGTLSMKEGTYTTTPVTITNPMTLVSFGGTAVITAQ